MTFGKFAVDREERINYARMREYRLERTKKAMADAGIGCMVSFDSWDIRYISSVYVTTPTRWLEGNFVVLPRNGDPYVFAGSCFSPYKLREEIPWLKNKIWPAMHMSGKLARACLSCRSKAMSRSLAWSLRSRTSPCRLLIRRFWRLKSSWVTQDAARNTTNTTTRLKKGLVLMSEKKENTGRCGADRAPRAVLN